MGSHAPVSLCVSAGLRDSLHPRETTTLLPHFLAGPLSGCTTDAVLGVLEDRAMDAEEALLNPPVPIPLGCGQARVGTVVDPVQKAGADGEEGYAPPPAYEEMSVELPPMQTPTRREQEVSRSFQSIVTPLFGTVDEGVDIAMGGNTPMPRARVFDDSMMPMVTPNGDVSMSVDRSGRRTPPVEEFTFNPTYTPGFRPRK